MRMRVAALPMLAILAACGGRPLAPHPTAVVGNDAPTPPPADAGVAPPPECVSDCLAQYPHYDDRDGLTSYCNELCTPATEVDDTCDTECNQAKGPGYDIDENGDYSARPDTRTEDEIDADTARCEDECTIPKISDISPCVDACMGGDDPDAHEQKYWDCESGCDPDPYDQCRYGSCD